MSKLRDKIAGEAARETMNMIALIPVEETGKRLEKSAEIISFAIDGFDSKLAKARGAISRAKVDYDLSGDTAGARAMVAALKEIDDGG